MEVKKNHLNKLGIYKFKDQVYTFYNKVELETTIERINSHLAIEDRIDFKALEDITEDYLNTKDKSLYNHFNGFSAIETNQDKLKLLLEQDYIYILKDNQLFYFISYEFGIKYFKSRGINITKKEFEKLEVSDKFYDFPYSFKDSKFANDITDIFKDFYTSPIPPTYNKLFPKRKLYYFVDNELFSFHNIKKAKNFFKQTRKDIVDIEKYEVTQDYYDNPIPFEEVSSKTTIGIIKEKVKEANNLNKEYRFFLIGNTIFSFETLGQAGRFFKKNKVKGKKIQKISQYDIRKDLFNNPQKYSDYEIEYHYKLNEKTVDNINENLGDPDSFVPVIYQFGDILLKFENQYKAIFYFNNGLIPNKTNTHLKGFNITSEFNNNPDNYKQFRIRDISKNDELSESDILKLHKFKHKIKIYSKNDKRHKKFFYYHYKKDYLYFHSEKNANEYFKFKYNISNASMFNINTQVENGSLSFEDKEHYYGSPINNFLSMNKIEHNNEKVAINLLGDIIIFNNLEEAYKIFFENNNQLIRDTLKISLDKFQDFLLKDFDIEKEKSNVTNFETITYVDSINDYISKKKNFKIMRELEEKKALALKDLAIKKEENKKKKIEKQLNNQQKQKTSLVEKRHKINKINKIYKDNWIVSVDTEYIQQNNKTILKEIGYTMRHIKHHKTISKSFLIAESFSSSLSLVKPTKTFSQIKPLKEVLKIVEDDLSKCSLIIGNSIDIEKKILKLNGIQLPEEHFYELSDLVSFLSKKNASLKLGAIANLVNLSPINLHNASNDAYYGVQAFVKLMSKFNNQSYSSLKESYEKQRELINETKSLYDKKGEQELKLNKENLRKFNSKNIEFKNILAIVKEQRGGVQETVYPEYFSVKSVLENLIQEGVKFTQEEYDKVLLFLENFRIYSLSSNKIYLNIHDTSVLIHYICNRKGIDFKSLDYRHSLMNNISKVSNKSGYVKGNKRKSKINKVLKGIKK